MFYNKQPVKPVRKEKDKKPKDFSAEQKEQIIARGNPPVDNNVVRGYN